MIKLFTLLLSSLFIFVACGKGKEDPVERKDIPHEKPEVTENTVVPMEESPNDLSADVNPGGFDPWTMSVYIYTSDDGLQFEKQYLVAERAAVPSFIQAQNGDLVAVFQYFSEDNEDEFNVIAYAISEDMGGTWSEVELINFGDLPDMPKGGSVPPPFPSEAVDPTIAQLEDGRFRLYYTYQLDGDTYASPFSSIADTIDGEFVYEGKLFENEYDTFILDPAVVYFDGLWHYISSSNGINAELEDGFMAIHATSEDGQGFELQEDIYIDSSMLGGAVANDEGLRFYGSGGSKGERAGYSADAYTWEVLEKVNYSCSDPGVVYLEDGTYMMICQEPTN